MFWTNSPIRRLARVTALALVPATLLAQTPELPASLDLGGIAGATAQSASATVGVLSSHASQVAAQTAREISDASRSVYFSTMGEGATGVARLSRRAVVAAPGIREGTHLSVEELRLRRMQAAARDAQRSLDALGGRVVAPGVEKPRVTPRAPTTSAKPYVELAGAAPAAADGAPTRRPGSLLGRTASATLRGAPKLTGAAMQGMALAKAASASPAAAQFQAPFRPGNIAFAVGATAAFHLYHQLKDDEAGVDLGSAFQFVTDRGFWGGMVGSGLGYAAAATLVGAMIPATGGMLAVIAPLAIGMIGSTVGWQIGEALLEGEGISGAFASLSAGRILGQSGGSTLGLLLGANLGALLPGPAGAVLGAAGAVGGALLLGNIGAKLGGDVGDGVVSGDPDAIVASITDAERNLSVLRGSVDGDYLTLQRALESGDHLSAYNAIERLQSSQARLQAAVAAP
jgi:hypothetical protein